MILIWAVEVLGVFFLILEVCLKLKRVRGTTLALTGACHCETHDVLYSYPSPDQRIRS